MTVRLLLASVLVAGLVPAACAGGGDDARIVEEAGAAAGASGEIGSDGIVDLAVYFRAGNAAEAHLERVTRTARIGPDLPRRALEALVAGPDASEVSEAGLAPTLPASTRVWDLAVRDGTARVVLSPEVVRDAGTIGDSPAHEVLALAAIANTLTEFPSVDRVLLEVRGQGIADGEFWGGWGLPTVLVRDESLIGAPAGAARVPDLGRFATDRQTIGGDATDVVLDGIRVRDHLTHVRVLLSLVDAEGDGAGVGVPRVRARTGSAGIVLELTGVDGVTDAVVLERALQLSDPSFRGLRVDPDGPVLTARLLVDDARDRRFWLHSMTAPTSIVLDVKK